MNFAEIEWRGIDWIDLAQDKDRRKAVVNTAMNFRDPSLWEEGFLE
jgi:hypothetical protein